jgi:hypothetical protein
LNGKLFAGSDNAGVRVWKRIKDERAKERGRGRSAEQGRTQAVDAGG